MTRERRLKRQHPIFSPVALLGTLILALGLLALVYFSGGKAFSPGELSALNQSGLAVGGFMSHAEFGNDCQHCHRPFQPVTAADCEVCHSDIARQRAEEVDIHGQIENAADCAACHLEHQGADTDLRATALTDFDHDVTSFALARHTVDYQQTAIVCQSCHMDRDSSDVGGQVCATCHIEAEPGFMQEHRAVYGGDCLQCHDGHDTMANMTRALHADLFVIDGAHVEVRCAGCHVAGQFADLASECSACHTEPDTHQGMFGEACADCHSTSAWPTAVVDGRPFAHQRDTGFSLSRHTTDFNGDQFTCRSCHSGSEPLLVPDGQCADCHETAAPSFMVEHVTLFGPACQACHDGGGRLADFDHNVTWPLAGVHVATSCQACHVDHVFQGTPTECVACHEEPELHTGLFGPNCANCHQANGWLPARLTQHAFPVEHGEQGQLVCTACHATATYVEYACTSCHEHEPERVEQEHQALHLTQVELSACAACHPNGETDDALSDNE